MTRLLALAALAGLAGCDSDSAGLEVADLVVTAAPDGFLLETEDEYPCANYPLLVRTEVSGDRVTVDVEGVGEVEGCLTALGPATASVPYPRRGPPFYALEVEKDGAVDRYRYECGVAGCGFGAVGDLTFSRPGPR